MIHEHPDEDKQRKSKEGLQHQHSSVEETYRRNARWILKKGYYHKDGVTGQRKKKKTGHFSRNSFLKVNTNIPEWSNQKVERIISNNRKKRQPRRSARQPPNRGADRRWQTGIIKARKRALHVYLGG